MDTPMKTMAQPLLIKAAAAYIREQLKGRQPEVGIVLGSGLGKLADEITDPIVIPYNQVEGFPVSTAVGHKGNYIVGNLGGKCVIAMQGRIHFYEGYGMGEVVLPIRVMITLGIKYLFVSNAAGACNPTYKVGDLVIIMDHISLLPNPLIGPNLDEFGPRFLDMTCAYDLELIEKAERIAFELELKVQKGVYFGSTGPTYETPAEVRFYHRAGADLVGMSTIPEVIVARHCGMRVFGMSVATNLSNIINEETNINDGEDVVRQANLAADRMCRIFGRLIEGIEA